MVHRASMSKFAQYLITPTKSCRRYIILYTGTEYICDCVLGCDWPGFCDSAEPDFVSTCQ